MYDDKLLSTLDYFELDSSSPDDVLLKGQSLMTSAKISKIQTPLRRIRSHPILVWPPSLWTSLMGHDTPLEMMFWGFPQKFKQWDQYTYIIFFFFPTAHNIQYPIKDLHCIENDVFLKDFFTQFDQIRRKLNLTPALGFSRTCVF